MKTEAISEVTPSGPLSYDAKTEFCHGQAGAAGVVPDSGRKAARRRAQDMTTTDQISPIQSDDAVRERYAAAARTRDEALCCPVDYDARYLEAIPAEVVARDYGCGDPSRYLREADRVLDLGSGSGKICFIGAQIVGRAGSVIGIDENSEMLALARSAAPVVAKRIGYDVVRFRRGRIQDLALDLDQLDGWLCEHPVRGAEDLAVLEAECNRLRRKAPLIPSSSVDVVVSNCVLNLVADQRKAQLIDEIYRVLAPGGRVAISDIVSDAPVPDSLKADPELWSGCISGAFVEGDLLGHFERVGFRAIRIDKREDKPFAVVAGIEFRSVTVTGAKLEEGCPDSSEAISSPRRDSEGGCC